MIFFYYLLISTRRTPVYFGALRCSTNAGLGVFCFQTCSEKKIMAADLRYFFGNCKSARGLFFY